MSLIYDALKRAEDDNKRTTGALRAGERRTLLGKRRQQWMWALVAVLGVNAIVVTTLVVTLGSRSSGSRAPDTPAPAAATPVPAPAPPPPRAAAVEPSVVPRPAPLPPPAPPRVARVEPAPAVKAMQPPVAPVEPPRVAAPAAPARTAVPVAPAPRVAPTPPVEPPRASTRVREEAAPPRVDRQPSPSVESRKSEARVEPEPSRRLPITGEKPPGTPESESSAGARPLPPPAIVLQVVVYSDIPAQRMVFIEGRRLVEGDAIDAETTLERINQDGIVIRRRGVRYVVLSNRD